MVLKGLLLFLFLIAGPVAIGFPWTAILPRQNRYRILACFPLGYFIELAAFHFLAVPFAFFQWPFTTLSIVFSIVMGLLCIGSIYYVIRKRPIKLTLPHFTGWEWVYLVVFFILLFWQLYNGIIRDTTVWSYDDATYVTFGADTIRYNSIQTIDTNTGIAKIIDSRRALQSSLYYPAFLSLITDTPVTVMNRTILETFDILLAYSVFAYMASVVFKKKENGLIFLIILSVLHIFGHYSQYSITFRILGPNYQGKAVLAASLFPFFFTFMIQKLEEEYDWKAGVILLLLSTAATALTMFGAATFMMNLALVLIISLFRKERKWKHLLYFVWGAAMPILYGSVYFIYKYFRW